MNNQNVSEDFGKKSAAAYALSYLKDDMKVGLGTGSTASHLVRMIAKQSLQTERRLTFVATSSQTRQLAESFGLRISDLTRVGRLDLTLDGADEFDADLNLIKGGGGALLQEKIVASASTRMNVIASISKKVSSLGQFPLPVEIIAFGWTATLSRLEYLFKEMKFDCSRGKLRMADGIPYRTDEGNYILDFKLNHIPSPELLEKEIKLQIGVVDCGLFIGLCDEVIAGDSSGKITVF